MVLCITSALIKCVVSTFVVVYLLQAAEEQRLKEEQAQREHEEYLKMKEEFSVEEEGTDAVEEQDVNMHQ